MAGSLTLHWRERLTEDDVSLIQEAIERFESAEIDGVDLYGELIETEMFPDEVETLIEDLYCEE